MKVVKFILLLIYGLSFELAFLVYVDYHVSVDDLSTIVAKPVNNYNYHNANRHAHWQTGSVVDVYLDPNVNNDTKLGMQDAINKFICWSHFRCFKIASWYEATKESPRKNL